MSVLIKGMKTPNDCEHCRFCGIDVESGCWIEKNWIVRKVGEDRPSWCPIVEVATPHGRLIDGDALHERAVERTEKKGNYYNVMQYVISPFQIKLAPTIIEAED